MVNQDSSNLPQIVVYMEMILAELREQNFCLARIQNQNNDIINELISMRKK